MANGVKLATAYVDITADASQVSKQIKDALNQSVKDAEKSGKDLADAITKGVDPKTAGAKIGKDLSDAVQKGADAVAVGKKISDDIAKSGGARKAGQAIGKEIKSGTEDALKDLGKGALDEFKQGAKTWGRQVAGEIRSGDIKGALNDVGTTAHNVTDIVSNIGNAFGANLDGVRTAGGQIETVLGKVGDSVVGVQSKVKTVADDFQRAFSGDVSSRAQGLAAVFKDLDPLTSRVGVNLSPAADAIEKFAGTKDEIAGIAKSLGDVGIGLKEIPVLGPAAASALGAVAAAAGPLAAAAAMLMMIPGWANAAGNALDQAQGKKPFNLKDWVHTLAPGTNIEELILNKLGIKPGPPGGAPGGNLVPDWSNALPFPTVQSGLPGTTPNQEGLLPVTAQGKQQLNALFPGHEIGGFRQDQNYPNEHPAGKALDFMVSGPDEGAKYLPTALGLPGVQYVIFNGKMWYPDGHTEAYNGPNPHTDHLHIHFEPGQAPPGKASGGALSGSGPVPIIAHGGEHVLTAQDVSAMGGQGNVYAWRKALHYQEGGKVADTPQWLKDEAAKAGMSPEQYLATMAHLGPDATPSLPGPSTQDQVRKDIFGQAVGKPGANPDQFGINDFLDIARTGGFIPSGAGSQAVAGTSFVAGILNLGNELVDTGIDVAASAAKTGIQMAIAAASGAAGGGGSAAGFGGSAAAGGVAAAGAVGQTLADWGIDLIANEGKRAVSYGFQVLSIGADSMIDQMFGMFGGPPRWLGYDYTQFLPHVNFSGVAVTTVEKAMQMAQAGIEQGVKQGMSPPQPGGPVSPGQLPGAQPVGPPVPKFGTPPPQLQGAGAPGLAQPGAVDIHTNLPPQPTQGQAPEGGPRMQNAPPPPAPGAPGPAPGPAPAEQQPPINPLTAIFGFDQGGWWMPGQHGINLTGRPELVLNPAQIEAATTMPGSQAWGRGGDTFNIYAMDADEVGREIDKRRRLAMMQYSGRP